MAPDQTNLPKKPGSDWRANHESARAEGPDPVLQPEYYDNISVKRIFAYVIDAVICFFLGLAGFFMASLAGLLSFGLLYGPLLAMVALIPIMYHTYFIGSPRNATLGMRFCDIRVYRMDGGPPEYLQAFVQTAIFYFTVPSTSFLILIVALFNTRRRCLHDMLAGTIVLNNIK